VLTTFDGSIEIRPWDKSEVQVVIEKRGRDHADVDQIDVKAEQHGNRIDVSIVEPKREHGFNLHLHSRSARLIVSMPASSDAGLAVTSHDVTQLNTSTFAGVTVR